MCFSPLYWGSGGLLDTFLFCLVVAWISAWVAVSPFLTLADHIGALLFVRNLVRGSMTNKPSKSIHFKKSVKMDRIHLFEVGRVCLNKS